MTNQDDIARRLIRIPFKEMHLLIYTYGITGHNRDIGWDEVIRTRGCINLLREHGWTVAEYATAEMESVSAGERYDSLTDYFYTVYV